LIYESKGWLYLGVGRRVEVGDGYPLLATWPWELTIKSNLKGQCPEMDIFIELKRIFFENWMTALSAQNFMR
jgi:hypothetical protein